MPPVEPPKDEGCSAHMAQDWYQITLFSDFTMKFQLDTCALTCDMGCHSRALRFCLCMESGAAHT